MKTLSVLILFIALFIYNSISFSQVKNVDISYLDSNNERQSYFKVQLEGLKQDTISFSKNGTFHKISLNELRKLGYIEDAVSAKNMLIGASISAGLWITFAAIASSSSDGGHPDFSVSFGDAARGTLVMIIVGGIIGGVIGGFPGKKEYVSIDLSKMTLNEKYEVIDKIFKSYGIEKE